MMALVENALPMRIGRELETLGFEDFGGKLKTPFTAHPKVCPATGELNFFGYRVMPPFLTYHVADAAGALVSSLEIPIDAPTMMHDFALTKDHIVFMDLPVVFDLNLAMRGTMPFAWRESRPARLAILKRGSDPSSLRWVDVEPCYVFHVGNAFEDDDGSIVLDVAWYSELWRGGPAEHSFETARLKRWRVRPGSSRASEEFIDDRAIEFPRINENWTGKPHSFVYAVEGAVDTGSGSGAVVKYDLRSGKRTAHTLDGMPSEFVHVPRAIMSDEDDGWLMGFVYDSTVQSLTEFPEGARSDRK
jgi:carotenoid cleavage dioxygenase-like enzyme